MQQLHRAEPTMADPRRPVNVPQRPPVTFLPLDGKEGVTESGRSPPHRQASPSQAPMSLRQGVWVRGSEMM